jgi:hypothetical protein
MTFYDQNRPFGAPIAVPEAPPIESLSWSDAAYFKRIHGNGFHAPPHMRGMTLAQLEAKAREETRDVREAEEAKARAARIDNAPKAIARALLDGPSAKKAKPQRGWRLRVRFLNNFRRCRTYREAAARVGVDESTVRRWRAKFEGFRNRCDVIVEERYRESSQDLKLRVGEPRTRPVFFRGKQVGEQVIHDDRALMFLMKLDDAARARAEAREERKEERAHEIRLREMDLKMHAFAAHETAPAQAESSTPIKELDAVPADIAPPQVVEVEMTPSGPSGHLPRATHEGGDLILSSAVSGRGDGPTGP